MDQEKEVIQIRDVTQDEILLSALRLFTTKGYFSTSLVDVAQLLEMENTSVIYQHFKDKKMMASQLYVNIFDSLDISVDDISRKNEKASEQLKRLTDLLFKLTDEAPDVMRFLLVLKLDEFLPDEKQIHETLPFLKVVKIIERGINSGEIRAIDPQLACAYFFGIVNNTLRLVLMGVLDKKADAYLSQVWFSAWNTIAKK